jgi:hypothetical protein
MFSASDIFLLLAYARTGTNLQENANDNGNNTDDNLWSVGNPSKVNY